MYLRVLAIILVFWPLSLRADEQQAPAPVQVYAPERLVETGVFKHILPRFTLKTQVRVTLVDDSAQADIRFGAEGTALFQGAEVWRIAVVETQHSGTARFADWLRSDIGLRTIFSYPPNAEPLFAPVEDRAEAPVALALEGDPVLGHEVAVDKCTRCHGVDSRTRGAGIGSTPSFAVLRALPDWLERFSAFYVLNPHPAFMQVTGVTQPFAPDRPPPIVPIEVTLDELEALTAYVAALPPADLGQPLAHQ